MRWFVVLIAALILSAIASLEWVDREYEAFDTGVTVPLLHRLAYLCVAMSSATIVSQSLREVATAFQVHP